MAKGDHTKVQGEAVGTRPHTGVANSNVNVRTNANSTTNPPLPKVTARQYVVKPSPVTGSLKPDGAVARKLGVGLSPFQSARTQFGNGGYIMPKSKSARLASW